MNSKKSELQKKWMTIKNDWQKKRKLKLKMLRQLHVFNAFVRSWIHMRFISSFVIFLVHLVLSWHSRTFWGRIKKYSLPCFVFCLVLSSVLFCPLFCRIYCLVLSCYLPSFVFCFVLCFDFFFSGLVLFCTLSCPLFRWVLSCLVLSQ